VAIDIRARAGTGARNHDATTKAYWEYTYHGVAW